LMVNGDSMREPIDFVVRAETATECDGENFYWFHPRVALVPDAGRAGGAK